MARIDYLSRILFDFGAIDSLGPEIERLGIRHPLLVTDPGVVEAGILERALSAAKPAEPAIFDATPGNPTEEALDQCLALWRDRICDGVIALGGGSAIDLAKAVALMVSHGGHFGEFSVTGGKPRAIGQVARQIAIPTAAGTGAEVGRASVLTLKTGRKVAAVSLNMVADTVICDPELTLSLPPAMTAATGIDALTHGIEAFCSTRRNPPADALALDCVERASAHLRQAVHDGSDREARWQMMMAALTGGMVLQKGLGSVHAMSTSLGEFGLHHGTINGVLLPHVLTFNADAAPEKFAALRQAIGLEADVDLAGWARGLVADIGLPAALGELGITADDIPALAAKAETDHLSATNPRRADAADYARLLTAAL